LFLPPALPSPAAAVVPVAKDAMYAIERENGSS
jgi:hypothetical protein